MAEQLLNARYRLLRPLGTGGMASVYLAEDLRLGRRVAVKILHPQFAADPAFVARFEQEARLAASLSHPNIVRVYDVGHDGDRHYIVMEYVEGETLKDTIAREGALPVTRALEIVGGVLAALDAAHAHNLIHRDVKAQNILITPDGEVKVADFGIARELGGLSTPTLTATGMVLGTAQYFAPEQAQGRPATPQSDVYAAGIVLFEMLTGRLPFDGENPLGVAMQQINQPPPLPRTINPAIPPTVEAIVLKALAKNPTERYATAGAMKAAVDAARAGAASPTRLAPRVTPPPPPPGVTRQSTRPTPIVAAPPPPPPARRATQRLLWIVAAVLVAIAAVALARYLTGGGFPGAGGAPTATPTVTATPRATATVSPSPTKRPVIVPPTATRRATHTPTPSHTPSPTETHTPAPSHTPSPTETHTPAPSHTPSPTETHTPAPPTDTPAPTATDTPAPAPTAPPTDTAVPTATTLAPTPTDTPTPSPSATVPAPSATTPSETATATGVSLQLAPPTAHPGDAVTVSGSGWLPNTKVAISTDYSTAQQEVADTLVGPDGTFSVAVSLPPGIAAGTYTVTASDGQGDTASQTLIVTI